MEHPSVELRFPFDDGEYRLGVPADTTHFYWGAIGIGTRTKSTSALKKKESRSHTALWQELCDRISCSLTIDGRSEPLLEDIRRSGEKRQRAYWKAIDLPNLPVTATVTLTTHGEPPSIGGEPGALWTHDNRVIPWNETVQSELLIVPVEDDLEMRTDGLWNQHEVYIPKTLPTSP